MLRILWRGKVSNDEVLRRAGVRRELMANIERRQLQFLGHVLSARGLEMDCRLGRMNEKRGRQQLKYMESLTFRIVGMYQLVDLARIEEGRKRWGSMVANVARQTRG